MNSGNDLFQITYYLMHVGSRVIPEHQQGILGLARRLMVGLRNVIAVLVQTLQYGKFLIQIGYLLMEFGSKIQARALAFARQMTLLIRLLVTGGISWRLALQEEVSSCDAAHKNVMVYREDHKMRRFLHWTLQWIGKEELAGYEEPSLSACEGPVRTLLRSFFNGHKDQDITPNHIDAVIDWPEKIMLLSTIVITLLMIKKIARICRV